MCDERPDMGGLIPVMSDQPSFMCEARPDMGGLTHVMNISTNHFKNCEVK